MITTYQFARKELQKGQQQIRQAENRQKCICGLKDIVNGINSFFDSLNSAAKDKCYNSCPDYNVHDGNSNYVTAEDAFSSIEYNRTNCFSSFCVNVRSLANTTNFENLQSVIELMNNTSDIIGLTETWLKTDHTRPFMNLHNYNFISKPRLNARGGRVGLYVKKSLTFWLRNDIFFAEGNFESILIELKFYKINIICGVIYSPPNHNFDTSNTFMSNLSALLLKLKNEKKNCFSNGEI